MIFFLIITIPIYEDLLGIIWENFSIYDNGKYVWGFVNPSQLGNLHLTGWFTGEIVGCGWGLVGSSPVVY